MQCSACSRPYETKLPFNCVGCARAELYEARIGCASALLEKESLERRVNAIVDESQDDRQPQFNSRWDIQRAATEKEICKERAQDAHNHVEMLRKEIQIARKEASKRRAALEQRRSEMASVTHDLKPRQKAVLGSAKKSIERTHDRWNQLHQKTTESKLFLCTEAAQLFGLRQRRRKKNGTVREDYMIGGLSIIDLRELNNASTSHTTTTLNYIARLLTLTSHYLALQLPAQINLPHRDYPHPTILSPSSSYSTRDIPFPGSTPTQSLSSSPVASRINDIRPLPRPRPLYLDKTLPVLAKEDPAAYALFIEGATLLAWDVAWVCRSQGLDVASNSWEEVCAVGRNLWRLLVATSPAYAARRPSVTKENPSPKSPISQPIEEHRPTFGQFSHGFAHSFLGAAEGSDHMRTWRLQGPMKVVDKVKSLLLGEMAGAEWEVLDEKEWDEDPNPGGAADDEAVMIDQVGVKGK